jgi:hypothetical protein
MFNKRPLAKKAQGMSLNVIIVAAIALIILVVLVFIFTDRIRGFGSGLADCQSKGGFCEGNFNTKSCDSEKAPILNTNCEDPEGPGARSICCVSVFK